MSRFFKKKSQSQRTPLLGLAEYVWDQNKSQWRLRPRWDVIGLTFGILMVLGYFSVAGAYYALNRWHRGVQDTSYADMLIYVFPEPIPLAGVSWAPGPIKRKVEAVRKEQARKLSAELFARGKAEIDAGNFRTASMQILQSSMIDAENTEARLLSSQLMLAYRRDDDAIGIMEEVIPTMLDKPEFVLEFIRTCFAKEKEARVIAMAKYALANEKTTPAVKNLFVQALASGLFQRGDFAGAAETIKKYNVARTPDGFMLSVRMAWETGRRDEAIAMLEPVAMSASTDPAFLTSLIELKKKNGDLNGAITAASVYLVRVGDRYQAHAKLLELLDESAQKSRLDQEIERYIRTFSKNEPAMLMLAQYASGAGNVALSKRLVGLAKESHFTEAPRFELLFIESHLKAGMYQETVSLVDKLFIENPEWLPKYRNEFDCLRMVAQMAMNRHDMSEIGFNRLKDQAETLPLPLMTTVSKKLVEVGRKEEAMRVINLAYERNGRSQLALNNVVDVHLLAGGGTDTPKLLEQLLQNRRPSTEILRRARKVIAGDAYLFEPNREKLLLNIEKLERGTPILPEVDAYVPKEKK